MTTNIQALADQAKKSIPHGIHSPDKWIEEYNKTFAQLIVRECANICRDRKMTPSAFTADELLEHFGIKE